MSLRTEITLNIRWKIEFTKVVFSLQICSKTQCWLLSNPPPTIKKIEWDKNWRNYRALQMIFLSRWSDLKTWARLSVTPKRKKCQTNFHRKWAWNIKNHECTILTYEISRNYTVVWNLAFWSEFLIDLLLNIVPSFDRKFQTTTVLVRWARLSVLGGGCVCLQNEKNKAR